MAETTPHADQAGAHPYTDAEWQAFRDQDYVAGRMVGGLMAAIFSIGVVLYAIVVWSILV